MLKKYTAILAAVVMLTGVLSGCQKNDNNTTESVSTEEGTTQEATTEEPANVDETGFTLDDITLTVWESGEGPDDFIEYASKKFMELHPNVTIEYVNVEVDNALATLEKCEANGNWPDVFAAPQDQLGALVEGDYVLPTQDEETIKSLVYNVCSEAVTYDGVMYGYPVAIETYALFYNKDLISEDQVPATWDDLVAFCKTFQEEHTDKRGFMMDVSNGYYTAIFTTCDDNHLFGEDGTDLTASNINSQAAVKGMTYFQNLRKILDAPAEELTTDIADKAFADGEVALYISGPWNVSVFSDAGVNFGVTTLPILPGEQLPAASFVGTRAMFVCSQSEHPYEASVFAAFLDSEEMQQFRAEATGALPAVTTVTGSEYDEVFFNQIACAQSLPSLPEMSVFWEAMKEASVKIWNGEDVKTALDACNDKLMEAAEK